MSGYIHTSSAAGYADGGLFVAAYSSSWVSQIFSNFRTGEIAVRGKNSGTWQGWRTVWDSVNLPNPVQSSGVTSVANRIVIDAFIEPLSTWSSDKINTLFLDVADQINTVNFAISQTNDIVTAIDTRVIALEVAGKIGQLKDTDPSIIFSGTGLTPLVFLTELSNGLSANASNGSITISDTGIYKITLSAVLSSSSTLNTAYKYRLNIATQSQTISSKQKQTNGANHVEFSDVFVSSLSAGDEIFVQLNLFYNNIISAGGIYCNYATLLVEKV